MVSDGGDCGGRKSHSIESSGESALIRFLLGLFSGSSLPPQSPSKPRKFLLPKYLVLPRLVFSLPFEYTLSLSVVKCREYANDRKQQHVAKQWSQKNTTPFKPKAFDGWFGTSPHDGYGSGLRGG